MATFPQIGAVAGQPLATVTPRHNDEPQAVIFSLDAIKQLDGLYCLNDLHRLSGGKDSDKPHRFMRLDKTKSLIKVIENNQTKAQAPKMGFDPVFKIIHGGAKRGIYGNRKIVYAYAMWIDPNFYDMVIDIFDRVITGHTTPATYTAQINQLHHELKELNRILSFCGRNLAIHGKQTKPAIQKEISEIMATIQPQLPLTGN